MAPEQVVGSMCPHYLAYIDAFRDSVVDSWWHLLWIFVWGMQMTYEASL